MMPLNVLIEVVCYAGCTRKTRIIDVVYNASNNELVRTKTLVKNCVVLVDSLPYRQWYEAHYATPLGRKKGAKLVRRSFIFGSSSFQVKFITKYRPCLVLMVILHVHLLVMMLA